ncbi:MAG: EamA family transporter [Bacteroidetes bacterium]|nr:EamA family transporter [Bacteroidota bacterium]
MIYLILAIFFSSGIAIIFKLFNKYGIHNTQAIIINYLLAVFAGYFASRTNLSLPEILDKSWFYLAIVIGTAFITTFFIYAISSQKAGVAISAVASRMSVLIPVLIGIFVYGEKISIIIIGGIALSLFAFFLILQKKSGINVNYKYLILPIILFLGFGFNDSMLKHVQKFYISINEYYIFLTLVFFVALILGLLLFLIENFRSKKRIKLEIKNLGAGIILGVFNFLSTYYFLKGMNFFESAIYFPVLNTGIVTVGAIAGRFLFKEEFTNKNWLGVVLAILAIFMLTLG